MTEYEKTTPDDEPARADDVPNDTEHDDIECLEEPLELMDVIDRLVEDESGNPMFEADVAIPFWDLTRMHPDDTFGDLVADKVTDCLAYEETTFSLAGADVERQLVIVHVQIWPDLSDVDVEAETTRARLLWRLPRFLLRKGMLHDVSIYANGRRYRTERGANVGPQRFDRRTMMLVEENVDVSERLEYFNADTLTVTFEGDLYQALNHGDGSMERELNEMFGEYGLHLEYGYAWSFSLYEN